MDSKMTTITAQQFVDEGYAAKIATGECVVKSPLYSEEIVSAEHVIKQNSESWDVAITDTKSTYRTYSNVELWVTWLQQPATASEDTAPTGAGEANYRDLYMSVGGSLAIIASWLRGSKGDMDDLTAQNIYDMIANEQGMKAQPITTVLVEQTELAALREQVAALTKERDGFKENADRFFKFYEDVLNVIENEEPGTRFQKIEKLVDEA